MSKYYSSSIAFGAKQTKTEKVVVSPTKIGDVTTDSVSGALTVDEVPTLDSLNPVSSDGVARAVIQAGAELPTRGSSDTGKVLTVANSDGDLEWDEPAGGASYTAGTGITISEENAIAVTEAISSGAAAGATAVQPGSLATVATTGSYSDLSNKPTIKNVPAVTSSDNNKVLTASYSGGQGSYSWQTAQGGGGGGGASYTAGQGIAIDGNNAISVDASDRDFSFGFRYDLTGHGNTYSFYIPNTLAYMHAKDQDYPFMTVASGSVHLVVGDNSSNYAVCNTSYEFSDWKLPQSLHIALSTKASDWTFTGNTFTINYYPAYLTVAGTTGSAITPNGETPVELDVGGAVCFEVVEEPNTLYLKNSIPTVDQSYNASSTHAQSGTAVAQALASAGGGGITWTKITSMTTTSSSLSANFSYSIPSGKTAVQVTIMLRLSNISGSWTVPKQLSVKLKLTDDYGSDYYYVGSIISADAWSSGSAPMLWMLAGTVVVPGDWYSSINGIQLELPMSGGSLPSYYEKALFVGIA